MPGIRSLTRPMMRQLLQHLEDITVPRLDELSGQIEQVRLATVEVQRIVTDDLDASNELAAHLGRALAELTSTVEAIRVEVAELKASTK